MNWPLCNLIIGSVVVCDEAIGNEVVSIFVECLIGADVGIVVGVKDVGIDVVGLILVV